MHVLIIGAAGMIGRKFTNAIVRSGALGGSAVSRLTLADAVKPEIRTGFQARLYR